MNKLQITAVMACVAFLPSLASAASGKKLFQRKCAICHSIEAGKNKVGPSLHGVAGNEAGKVAGYTKYRKGLTNVNFKWTDENLDAFLTDSEKFLAASSSMAVRVKKSSERAAIIKYLKAN